VSVARWFGNLAQDSLATRKLVVIGFLFECSTHHFGRIRNSEVLALKIARRIIFGAFFMAFFCSMLYRGDHQVVHEFLVRLYRTLCFLYFFVWPSKG